MDRRQFLALSVASFSLAACGGGDGAGSGNSSSSSSSSPGDHLPWGELDAQLGGELLRPGAAAYENQRQVYNTRYSARPLAVIRCHSPGDVQASIAFARQHGLQLVPRCGGHGYAGYSASEGGLVLDLSPLNSIQLEGEIAHIGGGAKLVDIYDQLSTLGVCIPAGSCTSVGIGGLAQGGGIGIVDRAYGLTCDTLVAAQVVLADGSLVECSADQHPELFWALRGGGGGNFGVVTRFSFQTHTTTDITTLEAYFDFANFVAVMAAWQAWPDSLPDSIWAQVIPAWGTGAVSPQLYLRAFCLGSQVDLAPHWQQFLAAAGAQPLWSSQSTNSYRSTMLGGCEPLPAACHLQSYHPAGRAGRSAFAASSDFVDQALDEAGLLVLRQAILDSRDQGNPGMMIMDLMRGAISRLAPGDTAFVHRAALFSIEYYSPFAPGTANSRIDQAQLWANGMRQILAPWSSGGAYVNYIDPLIEDWEQAYYGANYPRLQQVKASYDPEGFFRIPQGVKAV